MTGASLRWIVAASCVAAASIGCGDDHSHAADAGEDHAHTHDEGATPDASATDASATDVTATDASTGSAVELRFEATVGATPFSCASTFPNVGTAMTTWTPLDFRFYVHDVQLVPATGAPVPVTLDQDGTWQHQGVALLDFEDRSGTCSNGTTATNTRVVGRVSAPAGTRWTGLRFKLGVPPSLNHINQATAPSPLNLSTLWWSWQGGYKFARLDGRTSVPGFNIHLGSTGCTGDAMAGTVTCSTLNSPEVVLTGFDPTSNVVVADLARLLASTDVNRDQGGAPGCMSGAADPECVSMFPAFGIPIGTVTSPTQTFFRVR